MSMCKFRSNFLSLSSRRSAAGILFSRLHRAHGATVSAAMTRDPAEDFLHMPRAAERAERSEASEAADICDAKSQRHDAKQQLVGTARCERTGTFKNYAVPLLKF